MGYLTNKAIRMAEKIKGVKERGNIKILCGEANHRVYNNEELMNSIRYAKSEKDAVIRAIIGPVVSIDNDGKMDF
jgi:outer membrane receptor for monomeric catechols